MMNETGYTLADGVTVKRISNPPYHHWFGYYDKSPWDATGRYMLMMQSCFADTQPTPSDEIVLGRVDMEEGNLFEPFATTTAWCWQTGCMLQWIPPQRRNVVTYNARKNGSFQGVIHDLSTGTVRELPMPVFCVTPDGTKAFSLDFSRLAATRPGYGYIPSNGKADITNPAPEEDGVWAIDLETAECKLIVSLRELAETEPSDDMKGAVHWVNHIQVSPGSKRIAFLHRYRPPGRRGLVTRLFTANLDGSNLFCLNPNRLTSHYDWYDDEFLLAWARVPGTTKENPLHRYVMFRDRTGDFTIIGEGVLTEDGHCSWSPDRRWILTDTYPGDDRMTTLILYDHQAGRRIDVGRFFSPPSFAVETRCDLHPRWNPTGSLACIDSTHEGTRQVYVIDLAPLLGE